MARSPPTRPGTAGQPPAAPRGPGHRAPPRGITRAARRAEQQQERGERRRPAREEPAGQMGHVGAPSTSSPTDGQGGPPPRTPPAAAAPARPEVPPDPPLVLLLLRPVSPRGRRPRETEHGTAAPSCGHGRKRAGASPAPRTGKRGGYARARLPTAESPFKFQTP
ncbi:hypothetical protein ZWY2020_050141 [Hordeum vulgare]|nr:hypothetical protein ZWY2020_050141 [Hordeum vulgare]